MQLRLNEMYYGTCPATFNSFKTLGCGYYRGVRVLMVKSTLVSPAVPHKPGVYVPETKKVD